MLDLEIQELKLETERVRREIIELRKLLELPRDNAALDKEYLTIEQCAELKGGAALNTYKANRFLLPGCGNPKYAVYIAGKLAFPRSVFEAWKNVSDADLVEYAHECGVTVIPEKYLRLAQKAKQKAGGQ